ncbi:MAG: hypothetical protein DME66_05980 [Verrucomicrobia bacterium]|nr:MAG: hypothetical protein DME66_05980 [Verrucomicrobiota bacterium]
MLFTADAHGANWKDRVPMTMIEITPTATAGKFSRRPGVEFVFGMKDQAINYAQNRPSLSLYRALDFGFRG